jgi:hypothetical protein
MKLQNQRLKKQSKKLIIFYMKLQKNRAWKNNQKGMVDTLGGIEIIIYLLIQWLSLLICTNEILRTSFKNFFT